MPMYTFHICNLDGTSNTFEAFQIEREGLACTKAGELLWEHGGCDHVEIWEDDRPVFARYRELPLIRAIRNAGSVWGSGRDHARRPGRPASKDA